MIAREGRVTGLTKTSPSKVKAVYIPHMAMYTFQHINDNLYWSETLGYVERKDLDFHGNKLKEVFKNAR